MNILPKPKELAYGDGAFAPDRGTEIVLGPGCNERDIDAAFLLQGEIRRRSCLRPPVSKDSGEAGSNRIRLIKMDTGFHAYRLDVRESGIEVASGDSAGLFYGVQTLRQIVASEGARIPAVSIRDYPDIGDRGFMHDITRGKVPTLDTLKELAERMSYYKLNQLQLYVEHSFAYRGMTEAWREADPITPEEILELDDFCRRRYIELVPAFATFGHLYEVLRTKSFRQLCELEAGGGEPFTWPDRQLHHTLDVSNPESFELVKRMLDEFIPLFSSGKVNICCDETFDLGRGKNSELAERVGTERLYMDFLLKIIGHVKGYGKTVQFWDDILVDHPEFLEEIPKDVICLTWQYNADVREEKIAAIRGIGLKQYVCPGVSAWNRLAADMNNASANIAKSAGYARKHQTLGLLNTDWGDYGHINLLSASIPGMILGAALAWNGDNVPPPAEMDKIVSVVEYADQSGKTAALQRELGGLSLMGWPQLVSWYCDKVLNRQYIYFNYNVLDDVPEGEILHCLRRALEIERDFAALSFTADPSKKRDYGELCIAARGIALLNAILLMLKKYEFGQVVKDTVYDPPELAGEIELWFSGYAEAWRSRNKESELGKIRAVFFAVCDWLRSNPHPSPSPIDLGEGNAPAETEA